MKVAALALLALLLTSGASFANQACFNYYAPLNGTISIDPSPSTADPGDYINYYTYNWGPGWNVCGFGCQDPRRSHTYAAPPPYDHVVTLTLNYASGDTRNASCDLLAWVFPIGPEPSPTGTCCGQ